MSNSAARVKRTLNALNLVIDHIKNHLGQTPAVIGAYVGVHYGHARATDDIDLGVHTDLEDLIVMKVYSRDSRDCDDVVALLRANRNVDLERLLEMCRAYGRDQLFERLCRAAAGHDET